MASSGGPPPGVGGWIFQCGCGLQVGLNVSAAKKGCVSAWLAAQTLHHASVSCILRMGGRVPCW
eukprot:965916-Pelagomonas_calceolata.AAC.1